MGFFAACVCAVMSPYISNREAKIYGMVTARIPVSLYISSARHLESTAVLIFWMMVFLKRFQRLNVPMVSFCSHTALAIWNCVLLGTCTSGTGWAGQVNTSFGLMQTYVAKDVTITIFPWAPPPRLD